ncbi:MAG: type II toxin-antitoxin system PemK/MazF family toxin [Lachnospiraceae bacterium]|nr:type II toxin-antitoxin system PemK/MazF family toxin [Lachnospiraceae bacterium]
MTDKIVTVDKAVLGEKIGDLTKNDMLKISDQLKIILGLK